MTALAIIAGVVIGLGVGAALFKPIFGDWDELLRCIKFWLTPDSFSFFRGEYMEDWWAETKLGFYLFLSAGSGFASYFGIMKLFG